MSEVNGKRNLGKDADDNESGEEQLNHQRGQTYPLQSRKVRRKTTPRTNESNYQLVKPEYSFDKHLRRVVPYIFEYQIYAKKRWLGMTIGSVLRDEFRDRTEDYYEAAMAQGYITINDKACSMNQVVCNSDLIAHRLHRHEPPISSIPIDILFNDGKMLVVNKPSSMPVHPSGRYRFNSLVEILKHDLCISASLGLINRLDRLTSGICILSVGGSNKHLHADMDNKLFKKEYLARVAGHFPVGITTVEKPLRLLDHKLGVVVIDDAAGKTATTTFELLRITGKDSIVRCIPSTGRTHQIRVHLLHLGHPVANDPLYCHPCWARDPPTPLEDVLEILMRAQLHSEGGGDDRTDSSASSATTESACTPSPTTLSLCVDCTSPQSDPTPEALTLFLHAHRYSCADWAYTATPPEWAVT